MNPSIQISRKPLPSIPPSESFKLATSGVGIACLCEELSFLKESNLVPVLTDLGPIDVETYFVFHETLRGNKNIAALFKEIKAHA